MNINLTEKMNELIYKENNSNTLKKEENYKEINSGIQLLLESQEIIEKDIRLGFIRLATQNHKLIKMNENLSHKLERVENELNMLKQEREEKASRKEARTNRKRLPKRSVTLTEVNYTRLFSNYNKGDFIIGYPIIYGDTLEEGNGFTSETLFTRISE